MHWGETCLIDASGIDNAALAEFPRIVDCIAALPGAIGMEAHGSARVHRFGRPGHREYGITAVQLLMTSHCALHCCETVGELYLDITSCRRVDPAAVDAFLREWFGPNIQIRVRHLQRDPSILLTATATV
ncbi:MAG: hypothetical protein EBV03_10410 [Proteobacteria bacterium]|nr:hypothetical protein [Pseudomonadota bacterium]